MFDVYKIRKDFPMLRGLSMQNHPLIYLDSAATSLKPQCVIDAISLYYSDYCANSHRGDYDIAHRVDKEYEEARNTVAKFINADSNEVVFTSGASMSLNVIANGLIPFIKEGDEILLSEAEHASNVLPWFHVAEKTGAVVKYIPLNEEGLLTVESLKNTITNKTKVVALAHISNVLGHIIDVKELARVTHQYDAYFICDGAQSVPHIKTDVKDLDVDFLVFSAHKMCGPTGLGVLYGKFDLLCKIEPLHMGGGMNTYFDMCGGVGLYLPPTKFEAGTQNIAGVIGFKAAIDYINSIGIENIEMYEKELKKYAISKLKELDNVIIYNENSECGIITFNVKDVFAQDAGSFFNSKGIAVRTGLHCAKILNEFLKTDSTVRASLYFYNTKEEIDAFVEACKSGGDFLDAFFD